MRFIDIKIIDCFYIPGRGITAIVDMPEWLDVKRGYTAYVGENCWIKTTIRGIEKSIWPVRRRVGICFGADVHAEDICPGQFIRIQLSDQNGFT